MSGKYNESNQSISCSVCKQCGGCQYVDIPYEKELKKKSAYLKQLFEGICTVGEVHGMYRPAFYRNKVHCDRDLCGRHTPPCPGRCLYD